LLTNQFTLDSVVFLISLGVEKNVPAADIARRSVLVVVCQSVIPRSRKAASPTMLDLTRISE
jgi:hypothetical protein